MTVHNKSNRRYKNTISTHTTGFSRHTPIAGYIFITTPRGTSGTPASSFNVYIFCRAIPTIWYPRVSYTLANLDVSRVRLFGSPVRAGVGLLRLVYYNNAADSHRWKTYCNFPPNDVRDNSNVRFFRGLFIFEVIFRRVDFYLVAYDDFVNVRWIFECIRSFFLMNTIFYY